MFKDYFDPVVQNLSPELQTRNTQRMAMTTVLGLEILPDTTDTYELGILQKFADGLNPAYNIFSGDKQLLVDKIQRIVTLLDTERPEQENALNTITHILDELRYELRTRSQSIFYLTYFSNNYANNQRFGMPIQQAEQSMASLNDSIALTVTGISPKSFDYIKAKALVTMNDLLAYYNVLLLLEEIGKLYFETIAEGKTVIQDMLEYLLSHINNAHIHSVYLEHCFVPKDIPIAQRGSEEKTTRFKLFYEKNRELYQIRLDLAHGGEEYTHFNMHTADLGAEKFSKSEHHKLADTAVTTKLIETLEKRLQLTPLQLVDVGPQQRDEKDSTVLQMMSMKIYARAVQEHYDAHKAFTPEARTLLFEFLAEIDTAYADPDYQELLSADDLLFRELIEALGKRFKPFYL